MVLSPARQLIVTELGGKLRWIKRTIDAVEQPDAPKDEAVKVIRLARHTPSELMRRYCRAFAGHCRQHVGHYGNPADLAAGDQRPR